MSCDRLCNHLIISDSVTFTNDTLVINIPQNNYGNNEKYCIVVAQNIPDTTTINAPVVITIGDNETTYALLNPNCTPVYAASINTRTRYAVKVHTNIGGGVFSLIRPASCSRCINYPTSLPIAATATETTVATRTKSKGGNS